ncbi:efflux RND transporter permease subunit [Rubripirellula reticaptiva]|uniref:Multidrug resistance protein MdtB n=1 Tax=Rubripirellula reticaptiva TaxID=2528013 RepID=A0A5C6FCH8_9BACT|nr:efflux RND transporter permease subunit [Rubripirellula reticaptiva]TWU58337.1 Multidrug resistance protein MdtB [Rubripirellula reticaptiva]
MIRWFTINGIAANFLMLAIIVAGSYVAINHVPLEVTPALSWNTVMIEMQYRGATAKDVEQAILIPIEAALEGVDGIDSLNADGFRGGAKFFLRATRGKDLRNLMDDVKARIDTITTFPAETEPPRVLIPESANYFDILQIAVMGNLSPHDMRRVSRQVQRDLLEMPGISRVDIRGDKESEVSIEANVEKLLAYNLTFQDLADAIRGFSIDLPAGAIDSNSGTFIVRTRGQAYSEDEFNDIPIRSTAGAEVRLGEVATIRDGFVEGDQKMFFNGKPALFVPVMRVGSESALGISNEVREYVRTARTRFPEGIELEVWDDESLAIRHRLSTLAWSLLQGGLFVLLILGMFIRPSLAFWIVIGIPVSFAGAALFMPWFDLTANVMSLFGFIIVTGIVVDDAIVTGENVYSKIMEGIDPLEAAIEGTREVATPVTFGALTTVVAFLPLMFFDGTWGDYARQVPPVVAPVLLFSLIESKLILPAHLKHLRRDTGRGLFARFQAAIASGLERFIVSIYQPTLRLAVRNRLAVVAGFVAMAMLMMGYCVGGRLGFVAFPSVDSTRISAKLELPSDTPLEVTERYVDRISDALDQLKTEFVDPGTGKSLVQNIVRLTGARRPGSDFDKSKGYLAFEVMPPEERTAPGPKNSDMATRWSELVGEMPEARRFETRSESSLVRDSEYDDEDLNIELRGPSSPEKSQVARDIRSLLDGYGDLKDQWANINERQDELEIRLKPRAAELGLTQSALASQIRQAFFGEEAQRLQRGVDDVRVMVRLPLEARQSLHTLDRMRIRTPRGAEVPLETIAEINLVKAPSHVERNERAEIIRLGAQPVDETVDVVGISKELAPKLDAMCLKNGLSYQFLGYVAEAEKTKRQTIVGATLLMLTLYGLLAIALKSLVQPIYVLLAVPFAIIGALVGHILLDLTPSYLSIFGMLALAGIAVNDTLVMVDYINRRQASGVSLHDAALEAGGKRFRPIFLTSITTFMGLLPLMMDESIQAQFLIPMAVSLAFGVLFATVITLYMVPCVVLIGADVGRHTKAAARWYWAPVANR